MALNTTTLKPLIISGAKEAKKISFNWVWLAQRLPILALAVESSYNVYGFLIITHTPYIISFVGAVSFDLVFIGMVALADQLYEAKDKWDDYLFWCINLGALLAAFLFGLLYHSKGSYATVTPESFTRAIMFPVLSLLYNVMFHRKTKVALEAKNNEDKENPFNCLNAGCDRRFKTAKARNGHMGLCSYRVSKNPAKD